MTENKMRNIKTSEELIIKTFGVDYDKVLFNTFNITDKHLTFNLEWTETGNLMQATITDKSVKPKFTLAENNEEFIKEQMERLFFMKEELFTDDEDKVNDEIFENQEYDPARGYVEKKEVEGQEVMQLEDSKGE